MEKETWKQAQFEQPQGKQLVGLKSSSYREYLSARILFNNHLFQQACFFANSCLEKELKAYLLVLKINFPKKEHDTSQLYSILNKHHDKFAQQMNGEFFKVLSKIYLSRYFENLSPGYNFAIYKNKFLAELDYTYALLESRSRILNRNQEIGETNYEIDKRDKLQALYLNNYLLLNISKDEFLKQIDFVYELRILFNHESIEILYQIEKYGEPNNKFMLEALIPSNDHKTYTVSNKSYIPSDPATA